MLTEFIRYLSAERRYSPLTVRNYKHDVGQFLAWLDFDEARSDPRSITADQVREWIIHRTEEGKIGAASMNREIASIRTLFRWLLRTGPSKKTSAGRSPRSRPRAACRLSSPRAA